MYSGFLIANVILTGMQGTWQFMSAALVQDKNAPHTFVDDLESFLYVILWVSLMYSAHSIPSPDLTAFMQRVLDPDQYEGTGGHGKADFLQARTFLRSEPFPDRPLLHQLITELAILFAVRYEPIPTQKDMKIAASYAAYAEYDPTHFVAGRYNSRISQLESHQHVIELFRTALEDAAKWPSSDCAVQQQLLPRPPENLKRKTKTAWNFAESERLSKKPEPEQ